MRPFVPTCHTHPCISRGTTDDRLINIMMLRRALLPAGRFRRSFALAAQRSPLPYLHDLVGDSSQPGILGGYYGVKPVALVDVSPGTVVFREKGDIISKPSMHSIQIGIDSHCQIDGEGRFTAHSFSPNLGVFISPHDPVPISFVALRPIGRGEELSFDYTTTEWSLDGGGFVDASTSRPVRGFKYLEDEQKRQLLEAGLLPAHILQLWLGEVLNA